MLHYIISSVFSTIVFLSASFFFKKETLFACIICWCLIKSICSSTSKAFNWLQPKFKSIHSSFPSCLTVGEVLFSYNFHFFFFLSEKIYLCLVFFNLIEVKFWFGSMLQDIFLCNQMCFDMTFNRFNCLSSFLRRAFWIFGTKLSSHDSRYLQFTA